MSQIAVVHPNLNNPGGAEAVCMNVLGALENKHEVTLLTFTCPDLSALNKQFNTAVTDIAVNASPFISRFGPSHNSFYHVKKAIFNWVIKKSLWEFDLVISTKDEFRLPPNNFQYIHFPDAVWRRPHVQPHSTVNRLYKHASHVLAGITVDSLSSHQIVTNSNWTARLINDIYGVDPQVIYPPVDTTQFSQRPWCERETGFVCIGRLIPDKRIARNIEIVEDLVSRGKDVHLHIVGAPENPKITQKVQDQAAVREFIHFEGELSRTDLSNLVVRHKYGLHGKESEHFGIAVAEMVAAGMIPFMPNSGGQKEIVNGHPDLLYESKLDAVKKTSRVVANPDKQRMILDQLPDIESQFGRSRFQSEIMAQLNALL